MIRAEGGGVNSTGSNSGGKKGSVVNIAEEKTKLLKKDRSRYAPKGTSHGGGSKIKHL